MLNIWRRGKNGHFPPGQDRSRGGCRARRGNPNICESHGQCNAVAPEVYDLDDDGYCLIPHPDVDPALELQAEEGALACPVQALTVTR